MPINRRSFLKSGALSALTAAAGLISAAPARGQEKVRRKLSAPRSTPEVQIPYGAEQSPLFYFTQETFKPYVGGIFTASAGMRSISMTLVEVSDCAPKAPAKLTRGRVVATNAFALIFSSSDEERLTDLTTIYTMSHGALGEFPLFLTRRDGPAGTAIYEAVFNHLL